MFIETHDIIINDIVYRIQPFPATKGVSHLKKIVKVAAPSIVAALGGTADGAPLDVGSLDLGNLQTAVNLLVENMDQISIEILIKDLVASVLKDADGNGGFKPIQFDTEFMGNYRTLFKLILEVIRVNFGDVFTGLAIAQG